MAKLSQAGNDAKSANSLRPPNIFLVYSAIFVFVIVTYRDMLVFPMFTSEDTLNFRFVGGKTFGEILLACTKQDLGWFRPVSFFLIPYFIFTVVGIDHHNLFAIKMINLISLSATGTALYYFYKRLFPLSRIGPIIAIFYFLTLPPFFYTIFQTQGFEYIYLALCLISLIFFSKFSHMPTEGSNRNLWYWFSVLIFAIAINTKEGALTVAPLIFLISFFPYIENSWLDTPTDKWHLKLVRVAKWTTPFLFISLLFIYFRLKGIQIEANNPYRTQFHFGVFWGNLKDFFRWILRFYRDGGHTDSFNNFPTKAFFLLAFLPFLIFSIQLYRKSVNFRKIQFFFFVWMLIALILPAYAGGYPWHISLASFGYAIWWGITIEKGLFDRLKTRFQKNLVLAAVLIIFSVVGHYNFGSWFRESTIRPLLNMNESLLLNPPIPRDSIKDKDLIIIVNDSKQSFWAYGVGGLLNFVYLKPTLRQVLLNEASANDIREWLASPNHHCVDWNPEGKKWVDLAGTCFEIVKKSHPNNFEL